MQIRDISLCGGFISPSELLASPLNGKKTNVTPVHTKDSMEQTENNRPISLLCIISKDLESCVCITLNNHVKQFTSPLQYDFFAKSASALHNCYLS